MIHLDSYDWDGLTYVRTWDTEWWEPPRSPKAAAEKTVEDLRILDNEPHPEHCKDCAPVQRALVCLFITVSFFCGVLMGWMVWGHR